MSVLYTSWPASGLAESLKSFGRRRRTKVADERTRGKRALVYGECDFWHAESGSTVAVACLSSSFVAVLVRGAAVSRAGMMVEANHRIAIADIGHKMGYRPQHGCCGPRVVQSVPGHEGVLPVGLGRCGGALG